MVGDMSRVTLNFDLSKIHFVRFYPGSWPILTPKIKHVHLLVLIRERLQTPTTPTTPDATVQPLGQHIANYWWSRYKTSENGAAVIRPHRSNSSAIWGRSVCVCPVVKNHVHIDATWRIRLNVQLYQAWGNGRDNACWFIAFFAIVESSIKL